MKRNILEHIRTWSTLATLVVSLVVFAMIWTSNGEISFGG